MPDTPSRLVVLFLSLACTSAALVRGMARLRVMDAPAARKAHARPTPKGGGVGIVGASLLGLAVLAAGGGDVPPAPIAALALALAGIAVVSWLDDLRDWPFAAKLGAQLAAAMALVAGGFLWPAPPGVPPFVGMPAATLAWVLFVTNAVNFMDGLNGLAAGVSGIAGLFVAALAVRRGDMLGATAGVALAAGAAGFLPYNFPQARIFMGDVGSQGCGLVLAALGMAETRAGGGIRTCLTMPMLLSGLLFDVAFTLVRRTAAGENPVRPHRSHVYQVAHRSGMPAAAIALVHWAFAVWGGLLATAVASDPTGRVVWLAVLVVPPQLGWLAYVRARAARATLAW